ASIIFLESVAMISDELGFVGAFTVLGMIFFIGYRAFDVASRTASYFYNLVCVGSACYFALQTFVNLGGISGLIPLTVVPLPFMSFGGSFVLCFTTARRLI
ncbi:FtsW/RodA/SpoVE family cell cycle protein, partial [Staphylococcus pseudintermedius]|uniref:FtsW/RodA/SpoVE family cell cycle protein n=1 Tax=Staphylococcus pseudintermedius TaxID=283734 RepID=UPI000E38F321